MGMIGRREQTVLGTHISFVVLIKYHDRLCVLGVYLCNTCALHASSLDGTRVNPPTVPVTHVANSPLRILVEHAKFPGAPLRVLAVSEMRFDDRDVLLV